MKIYNIETQCDSLLHNLGVNASTAYFKHAEAEITTVAKSHPRTPVGKIAMKTNDGIAMATGPDSYLLVNDTVTEKRNGDGVLFSYPGESWTYTPTDVNPNIWSDIGNQGLIIDSAITALMSDEMTPLMLFHGGHKTGKTTLSRCVLSVIHGKFVDVTPMPTSDRSLRAVLAENKVVVFDNLERAESWFHDTICMAVTGATIKERTLYCNKGTTSSEIRNMVCITCIDDGSIMRDDVISRMVTIRLGARTVNRSEEEVIASVCSRRNEYLSYLVGVIRRSFGKAQVNHHRLVGWATLAEEIGLGAKFFDELTDNSNDKLSDTVPLVDILKEYRRSGAECYKNGEDLYDGILIVLRQKHKSETIRLLPSSWRKMSKIIQRHAGLIEKEVGLKLVVGKKNIALEWKNFPVS